MKRKITAVALSAMLLALSYSASAQQPTKIPRIGFLVAVSPSAAAARIEAFRRGLRELGYVEAKNIVLESRYAEEKLDRLPALAAELVRLKVDIIVTAGGQATRAAKQVTPTIPIVMTNDPDPIGSGFVASLARPAGNITGLSTLAPELSGKRLELLREIVPKLSRVAVLGSSTQPAAAQTLREVELAAGALKLELQYTDVRGPKDIETAFRAASKGRAEAVLVLAGPSQPRCSPDTDFRRCGKEPAPSNLPTDGIYGSRWPGLLWRQYSRLGPPRRYVCGQNFERRQAR